ncbi:NADP-dependent oxidoreductase [Shimia aestuarii]|uniref:Enoyl reductase (ER) domain-containing protein n=1 Tax=Shimia aestuarii TaxID=254406 RepID=A0A1I4TNS0_9RHOB|nr:NADP-dependent oxidoreductase [Shimia aestuarii]SFM78306.1 hypothetical protein SAMN04488042_1196 [Shimia aestuarii]
MQEITQIRFAGPADNDDLWAVTHDPSPALEDGQVRVRVDHVSVDPAMRSWITEKRSYIPPVKPGEVMRALGVGEVVASAAEGVVPGDWVTGFLGLASEVVLPARHVQKIDPLLAEPRAYLSGLGMTGYTAYFGLSEIGKPKAGETVVVSAASGGVGSIACQVAQNMGARVIGIAGGPGKTGWLRETLKLDGVIDYKNEDIGAALDREAPDGIDVFFDNVGGETLDQVLARINRHARIVLCGAISQYGDLFNARGPANYLELITQSALMQGFTMRDYMRRVPEAMGHLLKMQGAGKLTYRDHVLEGLGSFPEAFKMLYRGENHGKLLIRL